MSSEQRGSIDIHELLSMLAAEGERLTAFAEDLARLDEADEEAELDADDASHSR